MSEHLDKKIQHHIQRDIVKQLMRAEQVRFSELKPKGLESNLFMYHLKQLIADGLVQKVELGYTLTPLGKQFVSRVNLESLKIRVQPKILSILMVHRTDSKWLLLERLHQPRLHTVGFPSGKLHFGESLLEGAQRELYEKCNLTNANLSLRGEFILRTYRMGEVDQHMIGHVFFANVAADVETEHEAALFRSFWGDESDLFGENVFAGHRILLDQITLGSKGDYFVVEHREEVA